MANLHGLKDILYYVTLFHICFTPFAIPSPLKTRDARPFFIRENVASNAQGRDKPWRKELKFWLEDFEPQTRDQVDINYEYEMQADDPGDRQHSSYTITPGPDNLKCPPSITHLSDPCAQRACVHDLDCADPHMKCCYNGCVKTCANAVENTAPLIDWLVAPNPRTPGSSSWLMEDLNEGDGLRQTGNVCMLNRRAYADREVFSYEHQSCICENGEITCKVYSREEINK